MFYVVQQIAYLSKLHDFTSVFLPEYLQIGLSFSLDCSLYYVVKLELDIFLSRHHIERRAYGCLSSIQSYHSSTFVWSCNLLEVSTNPYKKLHTFKTWINKIC